MVSGARGPFRPGTGATPPYLAGRSDEQALFRDLLAELAQGIPPGTQVVLYGPRGNGKTVLLDWLEREAASSPEVATAVLRPAEVPDAARLAELLTPQSWWERLAAGEVAVAGFSWKPGTAPPPAAGEILTARAKANPLVLLVDEAHTLSLDVGRVLLNAAQEAGRKHPFLLVLAGTPNLEGRLNAMGVSFWDRAHQLRIGRLADVATAEAFRRPFEAEGLRVSGDVLAVLARESQRYPFFVQLLGDAVWRRAVSDSPDRREVTHAALDAGRADFETARGEFYAHRFEELAARRLLPVGRKIAEAFHNRRILNRTELEDAIGAGFADTAASADQVGRALEALRDLGYVWRVEARPEWEPGIPSLLDYIREHAAIR